MVEDPTLQNFLSGAGGVGGMGGLAYMLLRKWMADSKSRLDEIMNKLGKLENKVDKIDIEMAKQTVMESVREKELDRILNRMDILDANKQGAN